MRRLAYAGLAVVLSAAALASRGSDASARSSKGEGPTAIAAAFGSLWVATGGGVVLRLDAETAKLQTVFRGHGHVHALRADFGSIWVLGDRVARIDPVNERARVLSETLSATTFTLAVGAGAVWVADDGRDVVDRIDPRRTRRVAAVRVPGRVFGLAAGRGDVLVVSVPTRGPVTGPWGTRLLRRLDPQTNRVSPVLARLECDPGMTFTRDATWTTDPCAGTLTRRDARTLESLASRRIGRWMRPVAGFGSVWLVGSKSVVRIDPRTLRTTVRIRVGGTSPSVGEGALWILEGWGSEDAVIRRIDPRTNRVTATIRLPKQFRGG